MKRTNRIIIIFIFLLLVTLSSAFPQQPIITVLDFTTNNVSEQDMQSIISLLSSGLFRTGKFTVIDVSQRAKILQELEFSAGGCTDESCQLEIGKLLSAEMIVTGNISKIGSRYILSAKTLETETGKTLSTSDGIYTSLEELIDNLFTFAIALSEGSSPVAQIPTPPPTPPAEPAPPAEPEKKEEPAPEASTEGEEEVNPNIPDSPPAPAPQPQPEDEADRDYATEARVAVQKPSSSSTTDTTISVEALLHTGNIQNEITPRLYLNSFINNAVEMGLGQLTLDIALWNYFPSFPDWGYSTIRMDVGVEQEFSSSFSMVTGSGVYFRVYSQDYYDYNNTFRMILESDVDMGFNFSGLSALAGLKIYFNLLDDLSSSDEPLYYNFYTNVGYTMDLSDSSEVSTNFHATFTSTADIADIFRTELNSIAADAAWTSSPFYVKLLFRRYMFSEYTSLYAYFNYDLTDSITLKTRTDLGISGGLDNIALLLGVGFNF